jgi:hypothetical protein
MDAPLGIAARDVPVVDLNGRLQCDQKEIQHRENTSSHSRTPVSSSYNFRATAPIHQEIAGKSASACSIGYNDSLWM